MTKGQQADLFVLSREALFWLRRLYSLDDPVVLRALLDTAPPCDGFIKKFADAIAAYREGS